MKVLVCGGRRFSDRAAVLTRLDALAREHGQLTVIQGGSSGADEAAREWWADAGDYAELVTVRADWDDLSHPGAAIRERPDGSRYDAAAGPRRNRRMLDEHRPDLVLAFAGGRGTADMVRQARAAGVRVIEVFEGRTLGVPGLMQIGNAPDESRDRPFSHRERSRKSF